MRTASPFTSAASVTAVHPPRDSRLRGAEEAFPVSQAEMPDCASRISVSAKVMGRLLVLTLRRFKPGLSGNLVALEHGVGSERRPGVRPEPGGLLRQIQALGKPAHRLVRGHGFVLVVVVAL